VAVKNQTANLVASIGIKSRKDTQTPAIWGIAKVHTTYAVVSDHSNKSVKVIDTRDLRVTSEKRISHADFVWSLTSVNDNQIAVSVGTRGVVKILFFSVSTSGIISGTDKMIGVDCCFDGMVFSNNCLYGTYAEAIHVVSMQGRKIRTITRSSFGWLYGIALSNDQSTIYVTSYDNHKVISMDLEGTVKATYTDLNQPCGITVDSLGYVYVCSSGKRSVHQLSADLNKKQIIIQNVDSKYCTFNNTDNRLYLECLDTLKVFDMC
jgi:DNA-binding beta-propeller fold protein YncE